MPLPPCAGAPLRGIVQRCRRPLHAGPAGQRKRKGLQRACTKPDPRDLLARRRTSKSTRRELMKPKKRLVMKVLPAAEDGLSCSCSRRGAEFAHNTQQPRSAWHFVGNAVPAGALPQGKRSVRLLSRAPPPLPRESAVSRISHASARQRQRS